MCIWVRAIPSISVSHLGKWRGVAGCRVAGGYRGEPQPPMDGALPGHPGGHPSGTALGTALGTANGTANDTAHGTAPAACNQRALRHRRGHRMDYR
jgi:hypothetical protein